MQVASAATDLLELTEENVEKVLDEVSTPGCWVHGVVQCCCACILSGSSGHNHGSLIVSFSSTINQLPSLDSVGWSVRTSSSCARQGEGQHLVSGDLAGLAVINRWGFLPLVCNHLVCDKWRAPGYVQQLEQ